MTAGLPGTGIGGLYYLLLVLWMPCREFYLLCCGRSSARRWRAISVYVAMALCIIVTMWGEVWLLSQTITKAAATAGLIKPDSAQSYRILAGASIMLSLGSLVGVMVVIHVARLALWVNRRKMSLRPIVTGPVADTADDEAFPLAYLSAEPGSLIRKSGPR